ncbi:hypothetical protein MBLNU459_g0406t1 [Dothideomycetes sp. NU459]
MSAHTVSPEDITVFYWGASPWASKVIAYLALRRMPHFECDQPITLPRPDIKALGVNYRGIPVVAIGRDIYCDTLVIIERLEKLFSDTKSHPPLSAQNGTDRAMERLLEKWTDVVVFKQAADAIPSSLPLCSDPGFIKDRTELWGYDWTPAEQDKRRPKGLTNLRANFDLLEDLLSDGRDWVLGSPSPQLADIHAAWIFGWMRSLPDGLPEQYFSQAAYPKTHAWLDRYDAAIAASKADGPKPAMLSSEDALEKVLGKHGFLVPDGDVPQDPLGFTKGDTVEVFALDTGFNHRDVGKLVGLDNTEVVIEKASGKDGKPVRLHFPRWNFSIAPVASQNGHA